MINQTLLWLLALPVICALVVFFLRRDVRDAWIPCLIYGVVAMAIVAGGFFISKGSKTSDIELWNGQVTSKERVHGSYVRSYECNCTETCSGSGQNRTCQKTCQTCTEDHYTVHWNCATTVGSYTIDSKDWTNRGVYNLPDPYRYKIIEPGDPVAKRMTYVNYVQAVPNSLFTPAAADLKERFKHMLPAYPDNVYDFYRVDRFVTVGWAPADRAQWNQDISLGLRELGPRKQVNAIIVVAKTDDVSYEYALRDHWEGVNKNDVVLLIGSTQYPKIDFVRVISWTKNEAFKIELRDAVMEKGTIDRSIIPMMFAQINKNFERRRMREFAYLDGEIDPPDWLVYLLITLVVGAGAALWYFLPQLNGGYMRRRF